VSIRNHFALNSLSWLFAGICVTALSILGGPDARAQSKGSMKVGWVQGTPATVLFVAKDKGFFAAEQLDVQLIPFVGGPQNIAALAAKEIQIATAATVPFLNYLARRQDIVAIASLFSNGSEHFLSSGYVQSNQVLPSGFFIVKEDSPIRSVKDLRGKTIAAGNGLGTSPEMYTRKILKQNGLEPKDMTYTTLGFELMPGAVGAGTVDGAFVWEPFYTIARTKYKVRVIYTDTDVEQLLSPKGGTPWGAGGILVLVGRDFAEKNQDQIVSFLRAYKRSLNWIWRNLDEAKVITAKYAKYGDEVGSKMIISPGPRDGKVPSVSLEKIQNLMLEMGALKSAVPGWPERHVDYRYLDAAKVD
jgi:NitT/TauT family transport system substrate-binding protein